MERVKNWIKARLGKITFVEVETRKNKKWYGSSYGGFFVCPDLIHEGSIVYSFGIGTDVTFDMQMIANHGCKVYGFDPTPKSILWIDQQHLPDQFKFLNYGIGDKTEKVWFNLPKNPDHVSGSVVAHGLVENQNGTEVQLKTLADICRELSHTHIDVLKMDIEGSEYPVMEDILSSDISITQILVETHERFFTDGKAKGEAFFASLKRAGYKIFAVSDSYQEISLIKE